MRMLPARRKTKKRWRSDFLKYLWAYLLFGFVVALVTDWSQMRRDVPYGEFPSVFSLAVTRVLAVVSWMIVWPAVICIFARMVLSLIRCRLTRV